MSRRSEFMFGAAALIAILCAVAALTTAYLRPREGESDRGRAGVSTPWSELYGEMVSAFYSGVAALDVDFAAQNKPDPRDGARAGGARGVG